jgi:hypothetical protein
MLGAVVLGNPSRHPGDSPNGSGQVSHRRWSWTHIPIIQHVSNIIDWKQKREKEKTQCSVILLVANL